MSRKELNDKQLEAVAGGNMSYDWDSETQKEIVTVLDGSLKGKVYTYYSTHAVDVHKYILQQVTYNELTDEEDIKYMIDNGWIK